MNFISSDLMKISNEIRKMASTGKSDIDFELNVEGEFVFEVILEGKKIKVNKKPMETPEVLSFSAIGDDEGDKNIKDKLIKIRNAFFSKDKLFDYFKVIAHNGDIKNGKHLVKLVLLTNPTKTIFNGGRRGYLTNGEDLTFDDVKYRLTFEDDLIENGECEVEVVLENGIEKWYDENFKKYRD